MAITKTVCKSFKNIFKTVTTFKICRLNKKWALQIAKENVEKYYSVVGVLEEFNTTLQVIEFKIPYFFKGIQKLYNTQLIGE